MWGARKWRILSKILIYITISGLLKSPMSPIQAALSAARFGAPLPKYSIISSVVINQLTAVAFSS